MSLYSVSDGYFSVKKTRLLLFITYPRNKNESENRVCCTTFRQYCTSINFHQQRTLSILRNWNMETLSLYIIEQTCTTAYPFRYQLRRIVNVLALDIHIHWTNVTLQISMTLPSQVLISKTDCYSVQKTNKYWLKVDGVATSGPLNRSLAHIFTKCTKRTVGKWIFKVSLNQIVLRIHMRFWKRVPTHLSLMAYLAD